MKLSKKIIVSAIALGIAAHISTLTAQEPFGAGSAHADQFKQGSFAKSPRVGKEGGIDPQMIADARPMVDAPPDGLYITAPNTSNLLTMNVRVFNEAGERVLDVRSMGEGVDLSAAGLPNGKYRYEAVSVFLLDEPVGQGADYADEGISRNFGSFTIQDGYIEQPEARQLDEQRLPVTRDEASLLDRLLERAGWLAAVTLDRLVPSAHAADLTASSSNPIVIFDDTDAAGCCEWFLTGNGTLASGQFHILDLIDNNSHRVFEISGTSGSSLNQNSIVIESDGDISFANGAYFMDRSTQEFSIGSTLTPATLSIYEAVPDIRFHDESDGSAFELEFNLEEFRFWGDPVVGSFRTIMTIQADAPANSVDINSSGALVLGNGLNSTSYVTIGDGVQAFPVQFYFGPSEIWYTQLNGTLIESGQFFGAGPTYTYSTLAPPNSVFFDDIGNMGVGTGTPSEAVDVERSQAASRFQLTSFTDTGNESAQFIQRRSRGSKASPTAVQSGDNLGLISFRGHTGLGYSGTKAGFTVKATENWTGGANGTRLLLQTTQNGTTGLNTVMEITQDKRVLINGAQLNVPDYVFEDDYQLMTLDELSAFVKENKHLPGVANAETVRSEGLDMAGSQLSVLEKVEELTLYTIQQHEELKVLRAENAALQAQVAKVDELEQVVNLLLEHQTNKQLLTSLEQ